MDEQWTQILPRLLSPDRPRLEACRRAAAAHVGVSRARAEERTRARVECERRIEAARAAVFATGSGVVGADMTALEREWRGLSRAARADDGGIAELWAAIAPASWIERRRYGESEPSKRLAAAVLLAGDPAGVEAAEAAVRSLVAALAPWGTRVGERVVWTVSDTPSIDRSVVAVFQRPLVAAAAALASSHEGHRVFQRAYRLRRELLRASHAELRNKFRNEGGVGALPRLVAQVGFVNFVWRAASDLGLSVHDAAVSGPAARLANPTAPLLSILRMGYVVSAADAAGVVLAARDVRVRS